MPSELILAAFSLVLLLIVWYLERRLKRVERFTVQQAVRLDALESERRAES